MDKPTKEKMVNDIENRLDDFFGANDTPSPRSEPFHGPLQKLKTVVLSIDWEITDTCLSDLINETETLLPQYEHDRLTHALLRMLKALARYIRRRKAQAHPDAIKRVMSIFDSLEKLTGHQAPTETLRKHILAKEITAFKKLKQQVEAQRALAGGGSQGAATDGATAFVKRDKFEQAMNAVEHRLNAQVAALKTELEALQEELKELRKI